MQIVNFTSRFARADVCVGIGRSIVHVDTTTTLQTVVPITTDNGEEANKG